MEPAGDPAEASPTHRRGLKTSAYNQPKMIKDWLGSYWFIMIKYYNQTLAYIDINLGKSWFCGNYWGT